MKGGSAPPPDKNIGRAAMLSAQTGQDYLAFMKEQSSIANAWAAEDRERERSVFIPLQDQFIAEAQRGPDYAGVATDVQKARATALREISDGKQRNARSMAAMGVNPNSGRFASASRSADLLGAAAVSNAANTTRERGIELAEAKSDANKANAINLGSGLAVNPATSLGLANGAASSGFSGAMQGYNQQGSLLNTQYQQQLSSWKADQAASSSLWGGVGSAVGLGISMLSSKDAKEDKKPVERSVLAALDDVPVESWKYKDGAGDGKRHVGPYAEDFQKATGLGDGKSINVIDAIGVTMGAIKELNAKVDKLGATA